MIVLTVAVLIAAGIVLAAPPDPRARLAQLLAADPRRGGPPGPRSLARRGREEAEADQLWAIGAVESCAHLLKVGMTPQAVMATLAGQDDRLRPISRAIAARGQGLPAAAAEVLTGMAAVWTVSERSGAPAADMILRYAAAQRDALDASRERRIAMAGPRATVRVLSWLPLIGMGLGLLIGVRPLALLTGLPGQLSIGGGIVLYALGRWWMMRMMTRAER